jgi:hypothetical protein
MRNYCVVQLAQCVLLPAQYWNYELCHKIEVRQVHFEFINSNTNNAHGARTMRGPDWSLGHYSGSQVIRALPAPADIESEDSEEDSNHESVRRVDEKTLPIIKVHLFEWILLYCC